MSRFPVWKVVTIRPCFSKLSTMAKGMNIIIDPLVASNMLKQDPSSASIHFDELGDPDGIKLTVNGKKLLIDLTDSHKGEYVDYDEAMLDYLPTEQQAYFILAFIGDINDRLREAGGEPISGSYFTSQYKEGVVQIFGYQDNGGYSYIVPSDSKVINNEYKVRQVRLTK